MEFLLAAAILTFGLAWLADAFRYLSRALASPSWPTTRGKVTRSFVDEDKDDEGTMYIAKVTYRYCVGKREFFGTTIQAGSVAAWGFFRCAERTTDKYPVGATVMVRYLPRDPRISLLKPGFNFDVAFDFAAAIGLLAWAYNLISAL